MSTYAPCNQPVLLRSIEPGQFTSWAFTQRAVDTMDALEWLRKHLDGDGNDIVREIQRGDRMQPRAPDPVQEVLRSIHSCMKTNRQSDATAPNSIKTSSECINLAILNMNSARLEINITIGR